MGKETLTVKGKLTFFPRLGPSALSIHEHESLTAFHSEQLFMDITRLHTAKGYSNNCSIETIFNGILGTA